MSLADKKVAILVDNYFEQSEFEEPLNALKDEGISVDVIATKDTKLQALKHADKGDKFVADMLIEDVDFYKYDALILPGGAINADALRMNIDAQSWVVDFLDDGRLVAAICHAPWLLVSANEANGRTMTSYETIQDDIINAGGDWVDKEVVVEDNLITSRKPDDLTAFISEILNYLDELEPLELAGSKVKSSNK